jgi:hypothetical protein
MAQVEFRNETREIPDYLAEMMRGIETYKLTYDEAVEQANQRALGGHVERAFDAMRRDHFRTKGGSA